MGGRGAEGSEGGGGGKWGEGEGSGLCPLPRKFFVFLLKIPGLFWRILTRLFLKSYANGRGSNPLTSSLVRHWYHLHECHRLPHLPVKQALPICAVSPVFLSAECSSSRTIYIGRWWRKQNQDLDDIIITLERRRNLHRPVSVQLLLSIICLKNLMSYNKKQ